MSGVGETTINSLVNSLEEIVADIHCQTKQALKKCLHDGLQDPFKMILTQNLTSISKKWKALFMFLILKVGEESISQRCGAV